MGHQMLRAVLDHLTQTGQLLRCDVPVDARYELGAVLTYFSSEQPILFSNVKGHAMPVAGGLFGNRRLIYEYLGTTPEDRMARLMRAVAEPAAPRRVEQGPVQEQVITSGIDIRRMFPVPVSNEKDSAPFLTAGMFIYRNIDDGRINMAVRRFQVNEGNSINVLVSGASPLLREQLARCKEAHRPLECAVVLGYDAAFLLASQLSSRKYGLDKYEVDSALRGEPLELVRCRTIDLEVPAEAEIVFEGVIEPGHECTEGPFAELMGYYSEVAPAPLITIKAVTRRRDAIFQHAYPCREEHLSYGIMREMEVYAALRDIVQVQDVNLTLGGGCRLHAAVSIKKRTEGDAMSAILTTLGTYKDIKHVMVVDDDVDIFDPRDLEFALASRFQASRDLVIIPHALGSPLEASHQERGVSDKLGIDATKPLEDPHHLYERAVLPGFSHAFDIRKYFPDHK